ncbi:protein SpAN-like [Anneissia japonica]|uniref:protein SpAN-like n=1 Tax=Anneissia japonica TaxID=1529436 RepID=UPI0014255474|nr:protein SpAN-like [Anneissia japonica]
MKVLMTLMFAVYQVWAQSTNPPTPVSQDVQDEQNVVPDMFEGDIILTQSQFDELQQLIITDDDSVARKATSNLARRWPFKIIPYEITSSSENNRDVIMQAIHDWESNTCLVFKPKSASVAAEVLHDSYLSIFSGSGCWSYIGKIGNGAQQVSIGTGCNHKGTIIHELGHAIGFFHEQSRPDRDNYIRVLTENILAGTEGNFRKYDWSSISTESVPYDLGSIMHYGTYSFSKNSKATIVALNPLYQTLLGNRFELTFADIKLANIIYGCNVGCNELNCRNGGYVGPECTCVCAPGFKGEFCQEEEPVDRGCVYELTDAAGVITSPNHPESYNNNEECLYLIKGGEGSTITLRFLAFELEDSTGCRYDFLEVRFDDLYTENTKYCGTTVPNEITSVSNMMFVRFYSDISVSQSGFKASWVINGSPLTTESMIDKTSTVSMTSTRSPTSPDKLTTLSLTSRTTTVSSTTSGEPTTLSQTSRTSDEPTTLPMTSVRQMNTDDGQSGCAGFGLWTEWSQCSITCGEGGIMERSRICSDGPGCLDTQSIMCSLEPCPAYGEWTEWSSCVRICDNGPNKRVRLRSCGGDLVDCMGDTVEFDESCPPPS